MSLILGILDSGGAAVAATSYESIATINGTGSSGSITFSSIPSTYTHLQVRCFFDVTSSNGGLYVRLNSDTGNNYAWRTLLANGSEAVQQAYATQPNISAGTFWWGAQAGFPSLSIIDILDYKNTNKYKTVRYFAGQDKNSTTGGSVGIGSGLWQNTNAITSIEVYLSSHNYTTASKIALYGIKGS
jgi:hypothetical protein